MQVSGSGEPLDIVAITLEVSFELGKSEVVGFQGEKCQMAPSAWEQGQQSAFVRLGRRDDRDRVKVDLVCLMQSRVPTAQIGQRLPKPMRYQAEEIDVVGCTRDSIEVNDGEAAEAVERDRFFEEAVEL